MASARPGKFKPTPHADHDAAVAQIMASLPDDREALLTLAAELAKEVHAAGLAGDRSAAQDCREREDAIIWKLNGGTRFGCIVMKELVEERCGAKPGEVPMWGQAGEFVVTVDGMRVRVEKSIGRDLRLNAVDFDKPFLSSSGFWSALSSIQIGQPVEDAVKAVIRDVIAENGRQRIDRACRDRLAAQPLPAWVAQAQDVSGVAFVEKTGQMAFAF